MADLELGAEEVPTYCTDPNYAPEDEILAP